MEKAEYREMITYLKEDLASVAVKVEGVDRLAAILKAEELEGEWIDTRLRAVEKALEQAIETVEKIRRGTGCRKNN
ncbi:MAG: hypothetical protein LUD72_11660 [Bacteroidales bacterium]|nr:hypothetical protein [Bacteroidales bacterium]